MISFETLTLDNGLKIISNRDPNTAMAAVNVLYDTGSRDETRDLTGVAHLFEHVMFGGSAHVSDYSAAIEAAGGSDNAWTSNDYTNFYEVLPAVNIETAFWLESDRMLAPTLSEEVLDVQRRVVTEEFKQQCLNRPYGDLGHHLRRLLYDSAHPYSWPVIGLEPSHIARITRDDARRWFFSHYGPDNAVLAVSGNVDHDRVFALAEKWFGDIPRRGIARRSLPDPGFPQADVVETVTGAVPTTAVVIAFPMAPYGTRPYFAADTITDILSAGRSSRLYRDLIIGGDGLFSEVDASIAGSRHEGFLMLNGRLTDNTGRTVNFKNTIIIMTSNLGSQYIQAQFAGITPENRDHVIGDTKEKVMEMLKKTIRPEFLNRIDETIMFLPLTKEEIAEVVTLQMNAVKKMLEPQGFTLNVTPAAIGYLADEGFDPEFGARPVKRAIQRCVLNDLSKKILSDEVSREKPITIDADSNGLVFRN